MQVGLFEHTPPRRLVSNVFPDHKKTRCLFEADNVGKDVTDSRQAQ